MSHRTISSTIGSFLWLNFGIAKIKCDEVTGADNQICVLYLYY